MTGRPAEPRAPRQAREPRAKYAAANAPQAAPARALLDVNVLIALLDADHLHHRRATA